MTIDCTVYVNDYHRSPIRVHAPFQRNPMLFNKHCMTYVFTVRLKQVRKKIFYASRYTKKKSWFEL